MITLGTGSNYLRAFVTDDTGAAVDTATVTAEIKQAYGADIAGLGSLSMAHVAGHETDAVPYNYQATVDIPDGQRPGRFYQAIITASANGLTQKETFTVEVDN